MACLGWCGIVEVCETAPLTRGGRILPYTYRFKKINANIGEADQLCATTPRYGTDWGDASRIVPRLLSNAGLALGPDNGTGENVTCIKFDVFPKVMLAIRGRAMCWPCAGVLTMC